MKLTWQQKFKLVVIFQSYFEVIISLSYVLYYFFEKLSAHLMGGCAFAGTVMILNGGLRFSFSFVPGVLLQGQGDTVSNCLFFPSHAS